MRKTLLSAILCISFLFLPATASAITHSKKIVEHLKDGSCFETVTENKSPVYYTYQKKKLRGGRICGYSSAKKKAVTKSKTTYYRNRKGKIMWYIKVTGTFIYDGKSAKCIKSTINAKSKTKAWKIKNPRTVKKAASAIGTATAQHYYQGIAAESITRTVTLRCTRYGKIS